MKSFRIEPHKNPKDGSVQSFRCTKEENSPLWSAAELPIDEAQKKQLIQIAERDSKALTHFGIFLGVFATVVTITIVAYPRLFTENLLIAFTLFCSVVLLAYFDGRGQGSRAKRYYAKLLKEHRIRPDRCLICQYDLKGSTSETCPECGEPLAPVADNPDQSALPRHVDQ